MGILGTIGKIALAPVTGGASLLPGVDLSDPMGSLTDLVAGKESKNEFDASATVGELDAVVNPMGFGALGNTNHQFQQALANGREAPQGVAADINSGQFKLGLAQDQQVRAQQGQHIGNLQQAANGQVASAAELQQQQGLEQGLRQQLALANSAGGGNQLAALRNAQGMSGQMTADALAQGGALRAQEQAAARGMLGQQLGQARGADQATAGLGLQSGTAQAGLEQQMTLANLGNTMTGRQLDDARALGLGGLTQGLNQQLIDLGLANNSQQLDRDLGIAQVDSGVAAGNQQAGLQRRGMVLGALTGGAQAAAGMG